MTDDLIVMLTALNAEYSAVRRWLRDPHVEHERGTRFEIGSLPGTGCRVALGLTGKGNHPAGILAERAITRYSPVAVVFVGVAGALWESVRLGDVVVATHVYAYHGGTSEDDGLKARPRAWEAEHGLTQSAAHVARAGDWTHSLTRDDWTTQEPGPQVHFGAIAAGEIVQNSRISREAAWIQEHYNDALAIEMEAAGVAQAGHLNGSSVAIVRGISDRADGTKTSANDRDWQPRAAANAAAFAVRLADELTVNRRRIARDEDNMSNSGGVRNIAYGTVGIQAGRVERTSVHIAATQPVADVPDLAAELTVIREQLAHAYSAGNLDHATYEAAEDELDIAEESLPAATEPASSRFMLALKRLNGLIGDFTDLATSVAGVISAVNELS